MAAYPKQKEDAEPAPEFDPKLPDMQELVRWDVAEFFRPLIEREGFFIDPHTHKLTFLARGAAIDHPWVHVRQDKKRLCHVYRNMWEQKKIIHSKCLACWKIVVKPRTVLELFYLLEVQRMMSARWNDCWCKCGIEERVYVYSLYGGYFYTNSKERGLERLAQVREWVGKYISDDVPIYLKRFCTEFEVGSQVPSDEYVQPNEGKVWEQIIEKVVDITKSLQGQPPWLQQHIKRRWLEFAWANGDKTVLEFSRGFPLYQECKKYEVEEDG